MHARIVTADIVQGKREDAIRLWKEHVGPAFKYLNGCRNGFLLTHPTTGKYISISLWETKADAEEMETSGLYERLVSRFGGVFAGPPHCERYELSAQTESIRKE